MSQLVSAAVTFTASTLSYLSFGVDFILGAKFVKYTRSRLLIQLLEVLKTYRWPSVTKYSQKMFFHIMSLFPRIQRIFFKHIFLHISPMLKSVKQPPLSLNNCTLDFRATTPILFIFNRPGLVSSRQQTPLKVLYT